MTVHNNESTIARAISSFTTQTCLEYEWILIISLDTCTDDSLQIAQSFLPNERILIIENKFKSAAQNRNFIIDFVRKNIPECLLIGRLDADDELSDELVLSKIEACCKAYSFDVLLMGNYQRKNGLLSNYINKPDDSFLEDAHLLNRLQAMANAEWEAELPSCNVFFNPKIPILYPLIKSAEDHYFFVELLLQKSKYKIHINSELIYCIYSLDGFATKQNEFNGAYRQTRLELFQNTKFQIENNRRISMAFSLLNEFQPGTYTYLGKGFSGVVFHDKSWVYKIHISAATNNYNEIDNILYLKQKLVLFKNRKHFYVLKDFFEFKGVYILIYPFEESEKVSSLTKEDMISFLAEMWRMKIVCKSITRENNFVRVNGIIKLIDYEIEPYSDNLFLNVIARAYIQVSDYANQNLNYNKLKRSTINQFAIPELNGLYPFAAEIFKRIIQTNFSPFDKFKQPKVGPIKFTHRYDGNSKPKVSLLIKSCIQDSNSIFSNVRHIVSQLNSSVVFFEKVLLLDLYVSSNFLRQYSSSGTENELIEQANNLLQSGFIDRILIAPKEEQTINDINKRWFGLKTSFTHTSDYIPVVSQLYAFDLTDADYILQMDCDVLIGMENKNHDFLSGPIAYLNHHPNVVSVGFQIFQGYNSQGQVFFKENSHKIAPDPRCSIIDKKKLNSILPLPNEKKETGLNLSWYRSLEQKQNSSDIFSARGGDTSTFYIHPQNFRKESRKVSWAIMKAIENGNIPALQMHEPEVRGSIYDWTNPKRNEAIVVVLLLNDFDVESWKLSLRSISGQDCKELGLIVINNTGDFESNKELENYLNEFTNCTIIQNEHSLPSNEAIYDAIQYYMENPKSFVCLMRQEDVLLDKTVVSEIVNRLRLYEADVLVGKEFSEVSLSHSGLSHVNFISPRTSDSQLDNGLQVFQKQLFDSLSHFDLKQKRSIQEHIQEYKKIKKYFNWMNDLNNYSIMVPIVELARNPIRFDNFNVIRSKKATEAEKEEIYSIIKKLPVKTEGDIVNGRKVFLPNLNRIELDITYDCNLKCFHCNRSCTQAPTQVSMKLEQIKQFIQESIEVDKHWDLINILGGEPTLHPDFNEIVTSILFDYVVAFSPRTTLQVTSNGFGEEVLAKLNALPKHPNLVVDDNSFKKSRDIPYFTPFNEAPIDTENFTDADYIKGCWVTSYCGISLNHLGYYPCGIAGGIERVTKTKLGIKSLKEVNESIQLKLTHFCKLCGNFKDYHKSKGDFMPRAEKNDSDSNTISETWNKIYKSYNGKQ